MKDKRACCAIGEYPCNFPWAYTNTKCGKSAEYIESMACHIDRMIRHGYNYFLGGALPGASHDFANTVSSLRDNVYQEVEFELVVPYRGYITNMQKKTRTAYTKLLATANHVKYIVDQECNFSAQSLDRYLIDKSDMVLFFINSRKANEDIRLALAYATIRSKQIDVFELNEF